MTAQSAVAEIKNTLREGDYWIPDNMQLMSVRYDQSIEDPSFQDVLQNNIKISPELSSTRGGDYKTRSKLYIRELFNNFKDFEKHLDGHIGKKFILFVVALSDGTNYLVTAYDGKPADNFKDLGIDWHRPGAGKRFGNSTFCQGRIRSSKGMSKKRPELFHFITGCKKKGRDFSKWEQIIEAKGVDGKNQEMSISIGSSVFESIFRYIDSKKFHRDEKSKKRSFTEIANLNECTVFTVLKLIEPAPFLGHNMTGELPVFLDSCDKEIWIIETKLDESKKTPALTIKKCKKWIFPKEICYADPSEDIGETRVNVLRDIDENGNQFFKFSGLAKTKLRTDKDVNWKNVDIFEYYKYTVLIGAKLPNLLNSGNRNNLQEFKPCEIKNMGKNVIFKIAELVGTKFEDLGKTSRSANGNVIVSQDRVQKGACCGRLFLPFKAKQYDNARRFINDLCLQIETDDGIDFISRIIKTSQIFEEGYVLEYEKSLTIDIIIEDAYQKSMIKEKLEEGRSHPEDCLQVFSDFYLADGVKKKDFFRSVSEHIVSNASNSNEIKKMTEFFERHFSKKYKNTFRPLGKSVKYNIAESKKVTMMDACDNQKFISGQIECDWKIENDDGYVGTFAVYFIDQDGEYLDNLEQYNHKYPVDLTIEHNFQLERITNRKTMTLHGVLPENKDKPIYLLTVPHLHIVKNYQKMIDCKKSGDKIPKAEMDWKVSLEKWQNTTPSSARGPQKTVFAIDPVSRDKIQLISINLPNTREVGIVVEYPVKEKEMVPTGETKRISDNENMEETTYFGRPDTESLRKLPCYLSIDEVLLMNETHPWAKMLFDSGRLSEKAFNVARDYYYSLVACKRAMENTDLSFNRSCKIINQEIDNPTSFLKNKAKDIQMSFFAAQGAKDVYQQIVKIEGPVFGKSLKKVLDDLIKDFTVQNLP